MKNGMLLVCGATKNCLRIITVLMAVTAACCLILTILMILTIRSERALYEEKIESFMDQTMMLLDEKQAISKETLEKYHKSGWGKRGKDARQNPTDR